MSSPMNTPDKSVLSIMIVDDDTFLLKLLQRMLAMLGCSAVSGYESGELALAAMDKTTPEMPALVFLDLNMPNMDGIEFVRHLAKRSFSGYLVLISGEDERMLQSAGKLVSAHGIKTLGHLQKPVVPDALERMIATWTPAEFNHSSAKQKSYSVERLRQALESNELVNYYQPKVAVATGRVVGVEALVRWQHPQDGLIMPDEFIPQAEDSDLINLLAKRVLDLALQQTLSWSRNGVTLPLAINISMENLASLEFVDLLVAQVAAAGALPRDITLEITESRAMRNPAVTLDSLSRLRLKRFALSIDDFGTGHSSLAQLRDIPFDEFKIDKSFVHGAWADQRIKAMFDTSLTLAKQLGMGVVAEGIENLDDWEFLRKTSCEYAQGYFIARPMPGDELPAWVLGWQKRVRTELMPESVQTEEPEPVSKGAGPTVLVIEDHEFQRRVQSKILREENYQVVTAAGGVEALSILRKLRPNLILIDVDLPDISGLEILRRLRATNIFKRTPILMISGNDSKDILDQSRKAGASGYLLKPFDRKTLLEKISRIYKA